MALPGHVDYHVHYHIDKCAGNDMTLPNIAAEAARLGLEDVGVLKHYSEQLPNGQDEWRFWKRVDPGQFADYLADIRSFEAPDGLRMLAGVETELVDDSGRINIPEADAAKLDFAALSVHWVPRMDVLPFDPGLYPGKLDEDNPQAAADWRKRLASADITAVVAALAQGYTRAMECNPKLRVLGHMSDGLDMLRSYEVPVDNLGSGQLVELMEPVMAACVVQEVLWELTPEPVKCEAILRRAGEMGVKFSATADAHQIAADGWAPLQNRDKAEQYIDSLGLKKGTITLR